MTDLELFKEFKKVLDSNNECDNVVIESEDNKMKFDTIIDIGMIVIAVQTVYLVVTTLNQISKVFG